MLNLPQSKNKKKKKKKANTSSSLENLIESVSEPHQHHSYCDTYYL
jgi:hypothetical protein